MPCSSKPLDSHLQALLRQVQGLLELLEQELPEQVQQELELQALRQAQRRSADWPSACSLCQTPRGRLAWPPGLAHAGP